MSDKSSKLFNGLQILQTLMLAILLGIGKYLGSAVMDNKEANIEMKSELHSNGDTIREVKDRQGKVFEMLANHEHRITVIESTTRESSFKSPKN